MNESGRRRGASAISAEVSAFSSGCQRAGSPHVMPARSRARARPAATITPARALTRRGYLLFGFSRRREGRSFDLARTSAAMRWRRSCNLRRSAASASASISAAR